MTTTTEAILQKWLCVACGFVYDEAEGLPAEGILPGTRLADIPDDWLCPECSSPKSYFILMEE